MSGAPPRPRSDTADRAQPAGLPELLSAPAIDFGEASDEQNMDWGLPAATTVLDASDDVSPDVSVCDDDGDEVDLRRSQTAPPGTRRPISASSSGSIGGGYDSAECNGLHELRSAADDVAESMPHVQTTDARAGVSTNDLLRPSVECADFQVLDSSTNAANVAMNFTSFAAGPHDNDAVSRPTGHRSALARSPSSESLASQSPPPEQHGMSSPPISSSPFSQTLNPQLFSAPTGTNASSNEHRCSKQKHAVSPLRTPSSTPRPTVRSFGHYLMGTDPVQSSGLGSSSEDINDAWSIAPKRRGVYNLVQVPMRLEKLLFFTVCICADEFLFLFTLLPIRCAVAVVSMLCVTMLSLVRYVDRSVRRSGWRLVSSKPSSPLGTSTQHAACRVDRYRVSSVIDLMHLSIFVFTSVVLSSFDISYIYHNIRGQSVIKLYVLFNVMEIFDRLCCSFGVDILDSLGWTTASAVNYINTRESQRSAGQNRTSRAKSGGLGENAVCAPPFRGFVLLARVAVDYLITLVYVCLHATILVVWVVTLNVAINTQNNALLTLLVSNNFVELKGSVFKSYKVQNLFQIACSDGVERFQLTIFLAVMLVYARGDRKLLMTWCIIFLCEVIVDWIKHAFVTKFNRIPHRAYQQFSAVICRDIVQARKNSAVRSIGGTGVAKRVGFVSLPLGALVVRMAAAGVSRLPPLVPVLIFLLMLTVKVTLSVALLGHAVRRLKPDSERGERDVAMAGGGEDEEAWFNSLANVGRYDKS
jgi:transmembrane anterior posterior transformation protein 1